MDMMVVDLDNIVVFLHEGGPICHKTHISLNDDLDLVVGFNPSSSVYNERNFILTDADEIEEWETENGRKYKPPPSLFRPFEFNTWYIYKKGEKSV